jgi:hypothetical protein
MQAILAEGELEGNPMADPTRTNYLITRRSLLTGATAWAAGSALPQKRFARASVPHRLSLGANVNQNLTWIEPAFMAQTRSTWVRGFVPASEFLSGTRSCASDPDLAALRAAAADCHKVILSIKWDCKGAGRLGRVPAVGSRSELAWFQFADTLVRTMAGSLSVLVVVNELLVDTQEPDLRPGFDGNVPMIRFLRRLVAHLSASRPAAAEGGPLPIYAGGFTRLDLPRKQRLPAVRNAIAWINRDPRVAGADFHLHQPDLASSGRALSYIREQIPAKPLIVTEFSLVWKWKRHFEDAIGTSGDGATFAARHGLAPETTVREFCNRAFALPVPEREWQAFLASQPWFEPRYLDIIGAMMNRHRVTVATYALTTDPRPGTVPKHIEPGATPWFLNNLLVPGLAFVPGGRRAPENYGFFASFVKWQ